MPKRSQKNASGKKGKVLDLISKEKKSYAEAVKIYDKDKYLSVNLPNLCIKLYPRNVCMHREQ